MKHKHLELNIESHDKKGYYYHKAAIFRRKKDVKKIKENLVHAKFITYRKWKNVVA